MTEHDDPREHQDDTPREPPAEEGRRRAESDGGPQREAVPGREGTRERAGD